MNKTTLPMGPSYLAFAQALLMFIASRVLDDARVAALGVAVVAAIVAAVWRARAAGSLSSPLVVRSVAASIALAVTAGMLLLLNGKVVPESVEPAAWGLAVLLGVGGAAVSGALELLMVQTRATGRVDAARVERATSTALTLVAGAAGLIGIVYAIQKSDARIELAYAAPTSPSGATAAVVDTASCGEEKHKPEVFLFFERGSTGLAEVKDYFDGLAARGARVEVLDSALDPALSKTLKVMKNGVVAFRCGEKTDTLQIGAEREEAQRKLKKLDADVRTKLGKLVRDPVTVYYTTGHGERSLDGSTDKSGRPTGKNIKKLLDAQNATLKKLGLAEGLSSAVPDDAGLVIVFGPTHAFMAEETAALQAYVARGGALAVFFDPPRPGTDDVDVGASLAPLFTSLGVKAHAGEIVNDKEYVKQSNTPADHVFVFSTSFGTHKAVKTLNAARGKAALLFLQASALEKIEAATSPKVSMVARTRPNSFVDENGNRRFDEPDEKRALLDFAAVVEVKVDDAKEGRALIVGDSDVVSDTLLSNDANAVFAYETLLWLLRDDVSSADGATVSDDAPIRHTRDEDTAWFYGTVFGAPIIVMVFGSVTVRLRRRRAPSVSSGGAA